MSHSRPVPVNLIFPNTLTAGLFGIGYLVDFIKILCGKFTDKDGNLIRREKK